MAARRFRPATRVALFLASGGRCARCGKRLDPGWHADHVRPHSAGGATEPANGQALCPGCNLAKGGRVG
jgi:5-methylcytosine-specific restriction endonuclease McrA